MKISTGKTARAIRRREIISQLLLIFDELRQAYIDARNHSTDDPTVEDYITQARNYLIEISEISAIDANQPTKSRRRS